MSYFDYYCKNIVSNATNNTEVIKGTCYAMCPQSEIDLREKEHIVHVLEVWGQSRKLVKRYSRSAADSNIAVPSLLRPYHVLKETVQYLLLEVTGRNDVSLLTKYDFINDRLRSVRQDMTIQRLPPEECMCLLDPMVRFYVYFGYKLSNHPVSEYDPVLNKKYLLESLKWFLHCSDSTEKTKTMAEDLNTFMNKLDINEKGLGYDRVLMESLYILSNLNDMHPLLRYLQLSKELKNYNELKLAYKIAIANLKGNYIVVCRLIEELCPLSHCALCSYLPMLQRQALRVISHAYSSRQLSVPRDALRRWLRFTSGTEAQSVCKHYGFITEADRVRFIKTDFKAELPLHQSQMLLLNDEKCNINMEGIFKICKGLL